MYFWHIDGLVGELRTRTVRASEALGYLVALLVPRMLFRAVPRDAATVTSPDTLRYIVLALVVVGGLWGAYRANGGAAASDVAGRLLAVGWVAHLEADKVMS